MRVSVYLLQKREPLRFYQKKGKHMKNMITACFMAISAVLLAGCQSTVGGWGRVSDPVVDRELDYSWFGIYQNMRYVTTDFGGYEDENWNPVPKESGIYQGTAYAVRCYVDWCNTESDLLTGKVFVEYTDTHNVTVRLDYFESPKKKRPEVQMESEDASSQFGHAIRRLREY